MSNKETVDFFKNLSLKLKNANSLLDSIDTNSPEKDQVSALIRASQDPKYSKQAIDILKNNFKMKEDQILEEFYKMKMQDFAKKIIGE